jgi:hypothetical protein
MRLMFLNRLSHAQRSAYLCLARELVATDGVTTLGEAVVLSEQRREAGEHAATTGERLSVDAAAERFDTPTSRAVVLLELLRLARADREVSILEHGLIRRLAIQWRVGDDRLDALEAWADRLWRLQADGLALIGAEDAPGRSG